MSTKKTKSVRAGEQNPSDARIIDQSRRNVIEFFTQETDQNVSYECFTGTGGSYGTGYGASSHPTLAITRNKDQSRESIINGAEDAGVDYHEIIPFADSALMTTEHRFSNEIRELYHERGFHAKEINMWVDEQGGVDIDRDTCPYTAQMQMDMSEFDLLIGSPGHENVERYRSGRRIVFDDTHPVEYAFEKTAFDVSNSRTRAELNEFLRAADQLDPDTVDELRENKVAQMRIGFLQRKPDDAASPHFIDDLTMAINGTFVTSRTLTKLKVLCGWGPPPSQLTPAAKGRLLWEKTPSMMEGTSMEMGDALDTRFDHRPSEFVTMHSDDGVHWWCKIPEHGQPIVITTATDNDPITKQYFELIGDDYAFKTCAIDEYRYWQAKGLTVRQTSPYQNARSGGNINPARTPDLRTALQLHEGLDHPMPLVDAKKSINAWADGSVDDDDYLINAARAPSFDKFGEYVVGMVTGPLYYGDEYVEGLALFCGEDVTVEHNNANDSCSVDSCTEQRAHCHNETGQYILDHMMESSIKQGVGRFGRECDPGEDIIVYVDSCVIPPELPTEDFTDQMMQLSDGEKAVLDYIAEADGQVTSSELADELDFSSSREIINKLRDKGFVDTDEFATSDGGHLHDAEQSVESPIVVTMRKSTNRIPISEPVYVDGDDIGPQYPKLERTVTRSRLDSPSIPDPPDVI